VAADPIFRAAAQSISTQMASIYFRGKLPGGSWWIQYYHPVTRQLERFSLATCDRHQADALCRRLDAEIQLLDPQVANVLLPAEIVVSLGIKAPAPLVLAPTPAAGAIAVAESGPDAVIVTALTAYLSHILEDNAKAHRASKVSMLRQIFGSDVLDEVTQKPGPRCKPGMAVRTLVDLTAESVKQYLANRRHNDRRLSRKTKRHYREMLHHMFEVWIKLGIYTPQNPHAPNPMSGLPSYCTRKGQHTIVFLNKEQKAAQLGVLRPHPSLDIAARVMMEAGLRRCEALGLTRSDVAADFSYLRVTNPSPLDDCIDYEIDEDDLPSLKTGPRTVTILPGLRDALARYLETLETDWLVASPTGLRWDPDNFSAALRRLNKAAGLPWTAGHYRHTYATERAAEGWSVIDLANEMGTSYQMIQMYYAGYIKPAVLHTRPAHIG
jgi:integrase